MEYPPKLPNTKLFPMQENGCSGDFYIKQIKSYPERQHSFFQLWSLDFVWRE